MDQEPGRCRRTDGKKWRCSRVVLPDQKYCERHMHRGRLRSRKHVEVTEKVTKSKSPKTVNSNKTTVSIKPPVSAKKISNSSTQLPVILQPIHHPSSNASYKVCSAATPVSTTSDIVYSRKNFNANVKNDSSAGSTTYVTTYSDGNETSKIKSSKNILSNSKSSTVAPGSDIPPKGVLRSDVGCDISAGALREMPLRETEPQRCRRTDGRKWRCSSDVLPEQKYCVQHMHRGVKKLMAASNPMPIASFPPLPTMPMNLNTCLSITPASTRRAAISYDGTGSTSGSSSDATTITDDENTSDSSKYIIKSRTSNIPTPF